MADYIIFASGGNDSVALVQFAIENNWDKVVVAHSVTGWASPEWPMRMIRFKEWVECNTFLYREIHSEGMVELVRRKKAFPANKPQFCTENLKINPGKKFLDEYDMEHEAIVCVGVRRQESERRANWPEWVESSDKHGGRRLWSPLCFMLEDERNALIEQAGWSVLPHRSKECSPCVNANRETFRRLTAPDIEKVRALESEMGLTMFRPYRFLGAKGIDEVIEWAKLPPGKYEEGQTSICDAGMCGD